jgi:hypothetical protein
MTHGEQGVGQEHEAIDGIGRQDHGVARLNRHKSRLIVVELESLRVDINLGAAPPRSAASCPA